jgi:hypothetical protein
MKAVMLKTKVKVITVLLLLCGSFSLFAQDGTRGTDFWLTFGRKDKRRNADKTLSKSNNRGITNYD